MSRYKKLSRKSSLRKSILKGMVTTLIVNGSIETTLTRAKQVQRISEGIIALAVKEHANFTTKEIKQTKAKLDAKGRKVLKTAISKNDKKYDVVEREELSKQVQVDMPSRLAARRLIMNQVFENHTPQGKKRVNTVNKLFSDVAPKYIGRNGGYTSIVKLGARRGDSAEMVKLSLV